MVMLVEKMDGSETVEYEVIQVNGYNRPVVVKDKDGGVWKVSIIKANGETLEGLA